MSVSVEGLACITPLSFAVRGMTRPLWLKFPDFPVPVDKVGLLRAVPPFVWLASSCGLEIWASAAVGDGHFTSVHIPFFPSRLRHGVTGARRKNRQL